MYNGVHRFWLNLIPDSGIHKNAENLVKQTLNADFVQIVEIPTEYRFIVYVQSKYLVENMNIADDAIKKARPAHLGYEFINSLIRQNNKRLYVQ